MSKFGFVNHSPDPGTLQHSLITSNSHDQPIMNLMKLEEESEILARKAAKRMKRIKFDQQSEGFLALIVNWQRKRKDEKIKNLLNSLFPKLKNGEAEIRQWLDLVSERKEIAWQHGMAMFHELENTISLYEQHLDFLDEVIGDIQLLDYDILKEVNELRIAFKFNQELLYNSSLSIKTEKSTEPTASEALQMEINYTQITNHAEGIESVEEQVFREEIHPSCRIPISNFPIKSGNMDLSPISPSSLKSPEISNGNVECGESNDENVEQTDQNQVLVDVQNSSLIDTDPNSQLLNTNEGPVPTVWHGIRTGPTVFAVVHFSPSPFVESLGKIQSAKLETIECLPPIDARMSPNIQMPNGNQVNDEPTEDNSSTSPRNPNTPPKIAPKPRITIATSSTVAINSIINSSFELHKKISYDNLNEALKNETASPSQQMLISKSADKKRGMNKLSPLPKKNLKSLLTEKSQSVENKYGDLILGDLLKEDLVWDGEEEKRRRLLSHSISIQSLQLNNSGADSSRKEAEPSSHNRGLNRLFSIGNENDLRYISKSISNPDVGNLRNRGTRSMSGNIGRNLEKARDESSNILMAFKNQLRIPSRSGSESTDENQSSDYKARVRNTKESLPGTPVFVSKKQSNVGKSSNRFGKQLTLNYLLRGVPSEDGHSLNDAPPAESPGKLTEQSMLDRMSTPSKLSLIRGIKSQNAYYSSPSKQKNICTFNRDPSGSSLSSSDSDHSLEQDFGCEQSKFVANRNFLSPNPFNKELDSKLSKAKRSMEKRRRSSSKGIASSELLMAAAKNTLTVQELKENTQNYMNRDLEYGVDSSGIDSDVSVGYDSNGKDIRVNDPDQIELVKRIKKCTLLKGALKSILSTIQSTREVEMASLKKMKKLRNELKAICDENYPMNHTLDNGDQSSIGDHIHNISKALHVQHPIDKEIETQHLPMETRVEDTDQFNMYHINDRDSNVGPVKDSHGMLGVNSVTASSPIRETRSFNDLPSVRNQMKLDLVAGTEPIDISEFHSGSQTMKTGHDINSDHPVSMQTPTTSKFHVSIPPELSNIRSNSGIVHAQSTPAMLRDISPLAASVGSSFSTTSIQKNDSLESYAVASLGSRSAGSRSNINDDPALSAAEIVDDLKILIEEESQAKEQLAIVSKLINDATTVSKQLSEKPITNR